jgi:DNA ligase-1
MSTPFSTFAQLCEALEATKKRNEKKSLISEFLKKLDTDEIAPSVRFLIGRTFSETDERTLNVGGETLSRTGLGGQTTLAQKPITLLEVTKTFETIASATGPGSKQKRLLLVESLINRASPLERKYLYRLMSEEMRIGAIEGVAIEGIALASGVDTKTIQRANMLLGSLGEVAKLALTGTGKLSEIGLTIFNPVKPMLAAMSYDLAEVLNEHGGRTAFEWKFDGSRIQIHKRGKEVRLFSRQLNEVTISLPDIVSLAREYVHGHEIVVEGEAVALGDEGKPLPFQDLMRRFHRVTKVENIAKTIRLRLYLFDILCKNGRLLIDQTYDERRKILQNTVDSSLLAPRIITDSVDEAKRFLQSALKAGHEGLMAKALDGTYTPGVRGKRWLKVKPFETIDLAIMAAEWGYGRREGWLSNYHLGAYDEQTGEYVSLGKTFKGLSDEEFKAITKRLLAIRIQESRHTVYVKPRIVVEVAYNEIQKSHRYKSGYALRFARITRVRDDKGPSDVDTLERIRELYRNQFRAKGMAKELEK